MNKRTVISYIFNIVIILLYLLVGILGIPDVTQVSDIDTIIMGYYSIGLLFIFIIVITNLESLKKDLKEYFKHFKKYSLGTIRYLFLGILLFTIARIITSFIVELTPSSNNLITSAIKIMPFYVMFITVIYTPFVEEFIFRKILSDLIKNKYLYITISALSFGYLHVAGDFSNIVEFFGLMLPVVLFGAVIAYSYRRMNNVFVPVFIHFLYNLFLLIILL